MSTRRQFLQVTALAGGGLMLGFRWADAETAPDDRPLAPDAWLAVHPDGRVVIVVGKSEMGQGVRTSLPMIAAEELDADLAAVTLEQASPGPDHAHLGTGGSSSISGSWDTLRRAGAAAREMLVAAAAARFGVDPDTCRTESGRVIEATGERALGYGELAAEASRLPVPAEPRLKPASERKLLGRTVRRLDGPAIVRGEARYGIDVRRPGMRFAVVARPPRLGAKLRSFDASAAKRIPGVETCVEIPGTVAVVARSTWAALRGREALRTAWTDGPGADFSSAAHFDRLDRATRAAGMVTRRDGAGADAFAGAAKTLEALYLYPFEAHASVEPLSSTVEISGGRCEIWSPTQTPEAVQAYAARALGIPREAVHVHVTLLGGGFGRRLGWDFDLEAVDIAQRVGGPLQLVWSREDDLGRGYYQAAAAHRLRAGIDGAGRLIAWEQRKASTPHNARGGGPTPRELADPDEVRSWSWGVYDNPYAIPALQTSYAVVDAPVPIGPWRAVFSPSSVFARECFLDEVAQSLGRDPVELRHALLGAGDASVPRVVELWGTRVDRVRLRRVLDTAATRLGWDRPAAPGRGRGIACNVFHTGTYVAYAVEVSRSAAPRPGRLPFVVERVVAAVDCGVVVNAGGVEQQVESGVLWSLSNMKTEITFENGSARQSNYDDFRVVTYDETPTIEVHLVENDDERPRGLGEPTVCPLAPAVANALSRLTGARIRRLPVRAADLA